MAEALILMGALLCNTLGMAWLALSLKSHWEQVRPKQLQSASVQRRLRGLGVAAHAASLLACLNVDHATIASLVWAMLLTAAAYCIAFTLSWRPHLLRWLVSWVRE